MSLSFGGVRARSLGPGALAVAVFALTSLTSPPSHAFCRTTTTPIPASYSPAKGCFTGGLPLFWKNACVGYSLNEKASVLVPLSDATRVVDAAFAAWNAATCAASGTAVGITTSNLGAVSCGEVRYNQNGPNQNAIVFRDDTWPYSDPNNTLGLTTVTFNADTGEIYDVDMEINASGKNLTTSTIVPRDGFDLLSVVTHEAGHFLGLAHAIDSRSTMYASYRPGTSALRTLAADDVAGICEVYPTATTRNVATSVNASGVTDATACDPAPRHGFGSGCAENAPVRDPGGSSGCAVAGERLPASGGGSWASPGALAGLALLMARLRRK